MKIGRGERGALSMAIVAPVLAALIGGGAAVVAAVQVVSLAPSAGEASQAGSNGGPTDGDHNQDQDLQYGSR